MLPAFLFDNLDQKRQKIIQFIFKTSLEYDLILAYY